MSETGLEMESDDWNTTLVYYDQRQQNHLKAERCCAEAAFSIPSQVTLYSKRESAAARSIIT
jgi:hypothetical protein